MNADDYKKIKEVFQSVLEAPADERRKLLEERSGGDAVICAEVERLLDAYESGFLEDPADGNLTVSFAEDGLRTGGSIGHYTIVRKIGSGGMGEVYLAEDGKLGRMVAIKLLPETFTEDEDRLRRFEQEARTASALNHPNILTVHEIGESGNTLYIATEYIDGETLRAILNRGPLSTGEAIEIGLQCASALAAAHESGIIHRDIKPENIMIRRDDLVKILDFGLAKLSVPPEPAGRPEISHDALTERNVRTEPGVILGTIQYMSPEQTRGYPIDAGTDIWGLGCVMYEMLAGRPPFSGQSTADLIAEIVKTRPEPLSKLTAAVPERLDEIVAKALEKDRNERYQSAREVLDDLKALKRDRDLGEIVESGSSHFVSNDLRFGRMDTGSIGDKRTLDEVSSVEYIFAGIRLHKPTALGILVLLIGLLGTAGYLARTYWRSSNGTDQAGSFSDLRAVRLVSWKSGSGSPFSDYRASHNGKMVAYSTTQIGSSEGIYVKQTSEGVEMRVTKDEWNNHSPIWSPDDQRLAYVSRRGEQSGIYMTPLFGGAATMWKMISDANIRLRHWAHDDSAIFYESSGNLFRLDIATKEIVKLTSFADSPGTVRYFSLAPGEQMVAYCDRTDAQVDLWVMPVGGGTPRRLTNDTDEEMGPRWHPDGKRIIYNVYRGDFTQIDLVNAAGGKAEQITRGEGTYELIDVSADGSRIFYYTWEKRSDIFGINIESREEFDVAAGVESEFWTDVSPDGSSILYQVNGAPHLTTYLHESKFVAKSLVDRSLLLSLKGYNPRWLPDSRRIAFVRWDNERQKYGLWLADTATGEEKKLETDGVSQPSKSMMPINRGEIGEFDWSSNGGAYAFLDSTRRNIHLVATATGSVSNLTHNVDSKVHHYSPLWSPDGARLVYVTEERGTERPRKSVWAAWLIESGTRKKIYSTTSSLRLLGWSLSGDGLIFASTEGPMKSDPLDVSLLRVSLAGGVQISPPLKNVYATSFTLSPDRISAAYVGRRNDKDDIYSVAVNGSGDERKITANSSSRMFFGSPVWSRDGKTIFFDKQEAVNTISMFEDFK